MLIVGAVLIATSVIDTGDTTKEVVQQPISQPASQTKTEGGRTVADIYKREGKGVVYIQARGVTNESPFGPGPVPLIRLTSVVVPCAVFLVNTSL